jgi:hypothetical protein
MISPNVKILYESPPCKDPLEYFSRHWLIYQYTRVSNVSYLLLFISHISFLFYDKPIRLKRHLTPQSMLQEKKAP